MDYSEAMKQLLDGKRVFRKKWTKGIYLVGKQEVDQAVEMRDAERGGDLLMRNYTFSPYDVFASDWELLP